MNKGLWCKVPTEPNGSPLITSEMKAAVIGEFSITVSVPSEDGMQMIPQKEAIPWTTCKEIYKAMVNVARTSA